MNKADLLKALDAWWLKNKAECVDELSVAFSDELPRPDAEDKPAAPASTTLKILDGPKMPVQGKFAKGGPLGAVVHFTAGRYDKGVQSAIDCANYGATQDFAYWVIARDGTVLKTHDLDSWGWHCGASYCDALGNSLSKHLLGIEISCGGDLNHSGDTWWGDSVPPAEIVEITKGRYTNEAPGKYQMYTAAQETALIQLLQYLKQRDPKNFSYDNVLGHDEIALPAGRKCDPGGSLSMGMPGLRQLMKSKG